MIGFLGIFIWPNGVRIALFQLHPSKASGSNGMSAIFFQKFLHIIGLDVTNAILSF